MTIKTALVTGVLGFCGRHLVRKLREHVNLSLFGIDLAEDTPPDIPLEGYFSVDMRNQDRLEHVLKTLKPDWIFHLAGVTGDNLFDVYSVNFTASLHLFESMRRHSPDSRLVIVGSSAEYGIAEPGDFPLTEDHPCRPFSAYGIGKHAMVLAGLNYARNSGLKIVAARPFNIVGPGIPTTLVAGAIMGRIADSIPCNGKITIKMGNLFTERDFIGVDDAVEAYIRMIQGDFWGDIFNICSGRPYSIRKIVEMVASFFDLSVEIEEDPSLIRLPDINISFGSYARASNAFGFSPSMDIEGILYETWRYFMRKRDT